MVDKQEFHHILAAFEGILRFRVNYHAFGDSRSAGNSELRHLLDLDKTHAAVARHRECRMPAKMRHIEPVLVDHLNDRLSWPGIVLDAVDRKFRHYLINLVESSYL